MTRGAPLTCALALLALALPATAAAHAELEGTVPARDAQLARAPAQVVLRFDDPVDAALSAVRVFDARGRAVQSGAAFRPSGDDEQVAVRLRAGLADGGYTVTYRVTSEDSHPLSGGFKFSVGSGGPAGEATVESLLRGQTSGPVTSTAFSVVRAVEYAAIALGLGILIFLLACWTPGLAAVSREHATWREAEAAFVRRCRLLLGVAATAGLVAALVGIGLEAAVGEGTAVWSALRPAVVGDVLATRFGFVWAGAAALWLMAGAWLAAQGPLGSLATLVAPLALLPALSGHPSVQSPVALLAPANVLHVLAASAWLGGIAALVLGLRAATGRLEGDHDRRLLVAVVARFSALAGAALALLLATGIVQGVVEVASVRALADTAFGRAVVIKLVLFTVLVAIGWLNRARLLPALRAADATSQYAGVLLRRTLRLELGLGLVALAVTGALAGYAPA